MARLSLAEANPSTGVTSYTQATRPQCVRIIKRAGVVDGFGDTWSWTPGQIVRNPYVISLLAEHKVTLEIME
jgi:hypothetical protein